MSKTDLMPLAEEERADLLTLLQDLTPAQWNARSLCPDWLVRDVATHIVSYDELSKAGTAATFLRGGLRTGKVNDVALARYRHLDTDGIIELVARNQRPRGLPAGFRGGIALTDGTIHHQDIRRALGLPRAILAHQLVPVLTFSLEAPTLPSKSNTKGLKLVATDVDWTAGNGPQVTGPGEALLMAAAGRAQALKELRRRTSNVAATAGPALARRVPQDVRQPTSLTLARPSSRPRVRTAAVCPARQNAHRAGLNRHALLPAIINGIVSNNAF